MIEFNVDALKNLLKENNLNESRLAKKIGVSRSCINRIINNTRNPSFKFLAGLKSAFPQYSLDRFFLMKTLPISDIDGHREKVSHEKLFKKS